MTETTNETNESASEPTTAGPKKTRGPTRKTIIACDLAEEIAGLDVKVRADVLKRLRDGTTAASVREDAKALRVVIRETEAKARELDQIAKIVQTADSLPAVQRAFVVAAVEAAAEKGE